MRYSLLTILSTLVVKSMQRCSNPQAEDGDQVREGCLLGTCKSNVWRYSLISNLCCYERKAFTINTTISSSMSEDGCVKAILDCVEETTGNAKMVLNVNNYCEEYATKDELEEIKNILLETETGSKCQGEKVQVIDEKEDPRLLLLGPGLYSGGKSEVFSLPNLTPLDCNIPVFPKGEINGYVGSYSSAGVHMCGGYANNDLTSSSSRGYISSCYLLTSKGYKDMPGMLTKRHDAASALTPQGWWVTGGDTGDLIFSTTELWRNNQWQEHVRLPVPLSGHCMTKVNKSHTLLTGGVTEDWKHSASSFLYSEETGFTMIEDMKTPRRGHGCSVINDNVVFVAGGYGTDWNPLRETEYLDLTTLTWSHGPELPTLAEGNTRMIGSILIGKDKIFQLEELGLLGGEEFQWQGVTELKNERHRFGSFIISKELCE